MILKISLGKHQLAVTYGRRRGRPPKTSVGEAKKFLFYLRRVAVDRRFSGHPLSRVLRRVAENARIRKLVSLNLVAVTLVSGVLVPTISANQAGQAEETVINPFVIQLTTEEAIRHPLESFEISQGYKLFHRAIDFRAPTGTPIYPIANGIVKQVSFGHLGYGNYLTIAHGSEFDSLYAHCAKILVRENQEVKKDTVIGTVGSTGLSSGPHLHLETHDHGQPFNPLTILR